MPSHLVKTLKTALAAAGGGATGALLSFLEKGGDISKLDRKYIITAALIAVLHLWLPSPNQKN